MLEIKLHNEVTGEVIPLLMHSSKMVITYDGASGKTFLYNSLTRADIKPLVTISCDTRRISMIYTKDSYKLLKSDDNYIVIGDEDILHMGPNVDHELEHLHIPMLFICRQSKWLINTDIRDIYYCYYDEFKLEVKPLCKIKPTETPIGKYDAILTESSADKSEHLLLRQLLGINAFACSGRGKLYKCLNRLYANGCKRVLLIFDTSALGVEFETLNFFSDLMDITLYDYPSFEGLLYYSKLVQSLPNVMRPSRYRSLTLEREYEELLRLATSGTQFRVTHKPSKISGCFLSKCLECCDRHDSNTLFKVLLNKYGIGLLSWYLTNYTDFLNTYASLVKDNSVIPEQQTHDILMFIAPSYLGDLFPKCFPEDI